MVGVLLLNATYEPLVVVDHRRAITLLLGGKVDVVESRSRVIASAHQRIALPSIIRLRRYVNVPRRGAVWSKRAVFARDHYTCVYCGTKLTGRDATIDHVVPQWYCKEHNIPANTWTNTVAACRACQERKGGRAMHEAGIHFYDSAFEPKRPRTRYLVLTSDIAPEWKQYIEM